MAQLPPPDGVLTVESSLAEAWQDAPLDPDPNTDLDYEIKPLTIIKTGDGGHYMILPGEEDHLSDDEFMVADPGSVCLLEECR
ncbi:hypothetical protein EGH24_11915 [Halonotius terrestris]|uniref:Uncharacterized protein n=1 Tax=Halonotius terrestris TaxID=2487750 RepID=A0A8J8TC33_9EURY|nr:hypothetical protein [Halonotius terrestris]TQQ79330.1 hypothetical protein EGH24_11915 [Halonotius terrestris]